MRRATPEVADKVPVYGESLPSCGFVFPPKSRRFQAKQRSLSADKCYSRRYSPLFEVVMPDALDLLKTRRSVKPLELNFPGPSAAELETLLTIASRVPDHGKLTPWRFIVFEGDARPKAGKVIADVFRANNPQATVDQIEFERNRLTRAPLVVAVVSRAGPHVKIPEWEQQLSSGASAMSLVFAAHGLGYAASWITEWYAYDRKVLDAFGFAPYERIAGFVHIGTPAKPPEDRARPDLGQIVSYYGN
jgi:nitroreductase